MNELTGDGNSYELYALRHSFTPSSQLKRAVEIFSGSDLGPNFLLHSTKLVAVDGFEHAAGRYHIEEKMARAAIRQKMDVEFVVGNVQTRFLSIPGKGDISHDMFRFGFQVVDRQQKYFDELEEGLEVFPDIIARRGLKRNYLYVDMLTPRIQRMGQRELQRLEGQMREDIYARQRLYSVSVAGLSGRDGTRSELGL